MAKKTGNENSKKAQGRARKDEAANRKKEEANAALEAAEAAKWDEGSKKSNKKKEDAEFKRQEAARKKAERDLLLAAEESANPSKSRGAAKVAAKRAGKIDDFLDFNKDITELSASGIENALEALALTQKDAGLSNKDIDRHPERRVKAAFAAYEERRLPEMRKENPGLRLNQIRTLLFKEFQKSDANPMNQDTNIHFNATRDEVQNKKHEVKSSREKRFN